jgi:hypothetical protein
MKYQLKTRIFIKVELPKELLDVIPANLPSSQNVCNSARHHWNAGEDFLSCNFNQPYFDTFFHSTYVLLEFYYDKGVEHKVINNAFLKEQ